MVPIRVLLVDDSPAFLGALQGFLANHPRVAVIGVTLSGVDGVGQVSRLQPDLVLMDLVMPGMNGLEALRRIRVLPTSSRVVILTFGAEPALRAAAEALGADGFLSKAEMSSRLFPLIDGLFPATTEEPGRDAGGTPGRPLPRLRRGTEETVRSIEMETDAGPRQFGHQSKDKSTHADQAPGGPQLIDELHALRQRVAQLEAAEAEHRLTEESLRESRTLRDDLEERVAERTAELEAFSYSVSHDLRAPLRALDGYTRILLEEHAACLPPEAMEYVKDIRKNAQKMGQLIDDLLAFSRLSRQGLQKRTVAPGLLAREALEDLRHEREGRVVEIVVHELPPCQADPALLRQVWLNLLGNALKYTRKCPLARIEIGSLDRDGVRVYFVRDNGAGFDMKYSGKLFGVFQRLHKATEYEGTGVGLAIVQRIVNRHGGRVWAEAAINQGATFYFTLPETGSQP